MEDKFNIIFPYLINIDFLELKEFAKTSIISEYFRNMKGE